MEPPNNTENVPQVEESHEEPAEQKLPVEAMHPEPEPSKPDAPAEEMKPDQAPAQLGASESADVAVVVAPLEQPKITEQE